MYNTKSVIERYIRDYPLRVDVVKLQKVVNDMQLALEDIYDCTDLETLRSIEGECARKYFGVFDEFILQQKSDFTFESRNRRPPTDNVNALLSFMYTILAHDCANACESVGLDPYVGFMHQPRSGRTSLALDIMEEFRPILVDRFVLSLINNKFVIKGDFEKQESGAVLLKQEVRKNVLKKWQEQKNEELIHPYLSEKINWGLAPYSQTLLLSRTIRGDIEQYPPFFWR